MEPRQFWKLFAFPVSPSCIEVVLLGWVPPPIPSFAAKSWFLLSWRAVLETFNAPLLNEVLCPTEVSYMLMCLVKLWFWTLVTADGWILLLAVGREQMLGRLAVKACSAILPSLGNRHWHLLHGSIHLASSPSCGKPPSRKKHEGRVALPEQFSCPTFQDVSWIFSLPFFF